MPSRGQLPFVVFRQFNGTRPNEKCRYDRMENSTKPYKEEMSFWFNLYVLTKSTSLINRLCITTVHCCLWKQNLSQHACTNGQPVQEIHFVQKLQNVKHKIPNKGVTLRNPNCYCTFLLDDTWWYLVIAGRNIVKENEASHYFILFSLVYACKNISNIFLQLIIRG